MSTNDTTATPRTITLPCLRCGEENASFDFCLADGETFHCQDCDESVTLDEVKLVLGKWAKIVAWAAVMPTDEDGE